MKRLLLLMLFTMTAHAQPAWQVCRSDWELNRDELMRHARLRTLFHADRDTALIRFITHAPAPESSVALFVPDEGDAIIELALASLTGLMNVPVAVPHPVIQPSPNETP